MKRAAITALENEKFVMGESVFKFEEEFAKYCGVKYAVSTSSGTFALQLSLQALGINSKDRVITTPLSFIATANSIYSSGATPTFADVERQSCNIDPSKVKEKLTEDVKAILPVHLYGNPANLDPIFEAAEDGKRLIIEDCCQAHGAKYHGKKVGSFGSVGCFSFYSTKNMTVGGDGGMVVTNDPGVAGKISKLRDCGRVTHYEHDVIGFTARLNTVNAAIGRVQLKRLDEWNDRRRNIARLYNELLRDIDALELPPNETNDVTPVYHLYVVKTNKRDELNTYLENMGIKCGVHYPIPIHLQPIYKKLFGYNEGDYPTCELACKQVLSLPIYPELETESVEWVAKGIREFFA